MTTGHIRKKLLRDARAPQQVVPTIQIFGATTTLYQNAKPNFTSIVRVVTLRYRERWCPARCPPKKCQWVSTTFARSEAWTRPWAHHHTEPVKKMRRTNHRKSEFDKKLGLPAIYKITCAAFSFLLRGQWPVASSLTRTETIYVFIRVDSVFANFRCFQ
jgi:hypothetical protein